VNVSSDHGPIRSFGRIKSRPIKPRQAGLLDDLLPRLRVPDGPVALDGETWLEIGFGGGEHLAEQAARHPDVSFIGAEPFLNGVASLLRHVDARNLRNVRIHPDDVRDLLERLPDASLARVFILFPDPWPKARHHKRRLLQPDVIHTLTRVLRPGGRLRFATDWESYAEEVLERFLRAPELAWTAESADDWRTPPVDHVPTRYEAKRLGDIAPLFLDFERR
jgi:tRNA (guanine-N7-)-methyltransferase